MITLKRINTEPVLTEEQLGKVVDEMERLMNGDFPWAHSWIKRAPIQAMLLSAGCFDQKKSDSMLKDLADPLLNAQCRARRNKR